MEERGISETEIEFVLNNHEIEYTDRDGNRILVAHPDGRYIKVVVRKDSDPPFVITAGD